MRSERAKAQRTLRCFESVNLAIPATDSGRIAGYNGPAYAKRSGYADHFCQLPLSRSV